MAGFEPLDPSEMNEIGGNYSGAMARGYRRSGYIEIVYRGAGGLEGRLNPPEGAGGLGCPGEDTDLGENLLFLCCQ